MATRHLAWVILLLGSFASGQSVRIGVLGLFHTRELVVSAPAASALKIRGGGQSFTFEASSGPNSATIVAAPEGLIVRCGARFVESPEILVSSRDGGPVDFLLTIPGRISRRYRGTLAISETSGVLVPVVTMDLETAVASVVAAESLPSDPLEALKAQAVAARSYLRAARGRHRNFDFCDTTHCQFLREPPKPDAAAARAAMATRGLVVEYRSQVFAAMYTRSCSGRTRTPADLGLPAGSYPYYSVVCRYCREHPRYWRSSISAQDASGLRPHDEAARIATGRRLGWNRVESDDFTMARRGVEAVIEGVGQGHGIGLCQAGARAMAKEGADFRQILAHYYPNTVVTSLEQESADSGALSQIMSSQ